MKDLHLLAIYHAGRTYLAAPFNGAGYVDDLVKNSTDKDILWSTSAGNFAQKHYQGNFSGADNGYHNFSGNDQCINFSAEAGHSIQGVLSWDDWPYSDQDYDLELYYVNNTELVDTSEDSQNGTQEPYEIIETKAPYSGTYCFKVYNYSANKTSQLELFSADEFTEYNVVNSSIVSPADEESAVAVGATGPDDIIHNYSSRGPTNDGRIKPDVTAPSGVSTSTYESFYGTSASAPHVAGAAALVLSSNPSMSPQDLKKTFMSTATDLGVEGENNVYGSGRINVLEALCNTTSVWRTNNSTAIQDAINIAGEGDTIFLEAGRYTGNVVVNKSISIQCNSTCILKPDDLHSALLQIVEDNVTVKGSTFKGSEVSILMSNSSNCNISNNRIVNASKGIYLYNSEYNVLNNNTILRNQAGTTLNSSENNSITKNTLKENKYGITFYYSNSNDIYLNNFVNNSLNVHSHNSSNIWNSTEKITYTYNDNTYTNNLGNYWSNYTDSDPDGDGVGDTPYSINGASDPYPLIQPFKNYLVGVEITKFKGTALNYIEATKPGAPYGWKVNITEVVSGTQPCSNHINVTIQAVSPPKGYMDDNITAGDKVEVYGKYVENDGCSVTLIGSKDYYIKKVSGEQETNPDNIEDSKEQIISKYNKLNWKTQTPDKNTVVNAVTNAVGQYFSAESEQEKSEIVNDVTQMVSLYFQLES